MKNKIISLFGGLTLLLVLFLLPANKVSAACVATSITPQTTVSGTLDTSDCTKTAPAGGIAYYDKYTFTGYPNERIQIFMQNIPSTLYPYVYLVRPDGTTETQNSFGISDYILPSTATVGTYTIWATTYYGTNSGNTIYYLGQYNLSLGVSPLAPTIGTVTSGSGTASVPFTAPTSGVTPDGYVIYYSTDGGATYAQYLWPSSCGTSCAGSIADFAASPAGLTGLTNGTAYKFKVAAYAYGGEGPKSGASNSVTPVAASVPSTPTAAPTGTVGNASIPVTFTTTGFTGSPTSFKVYASTSNTS
ncbi:MAG: hypothetical protein HY226_04915, partial [Candidatus Vogelbacteria bacterium]|nr:hypothetical protein [Candidatus Vogelbacteria bacterium]